MNEAPDPLASLRDIHLPEPVSVWPLAIGWWVLLGVVAASIVSFVLYRRHRRRSLKTAALTELSAARSRFEDSGDAQTLALEVAELLRRVALARFPRRDVAALHGGAWVDFLESTSRKPALVGPIASELEHAVYAPPREHSTEDGQRWIGAAHAWIGGIA